MKNFQKGFVVPLLIGIIALLIIGGGAYIYTNKKVEVPVVVDNATLQSNEIQQQTSAQVPSVTIQTNPTGSTSLVSYMVNKSFDKNVKLADKELSLGFGSNYFLAMSENHTYKMFYDNSVVYNTYIAGSNTLYEHGDFQTWLGRQVARYNSIKPSGNGADSEAWSLKFLGTGSARVIGKYIDGQSIKVQEVITYIQ